DLSRFRIRSQIALDAAPSQVVAAPRSPRAYALTPDTATVYEIDAINLGIARRLALGNSAVSMRLSRSGDALWVLLRDPAVLLEVPLSSFRPARRLSLPAPPDSFELARETDDACIVARSNGTVAIISLAQAAITRTVTPAAEPSIACFRRDGRQLITGSEKDR